MQPAEWLARVRHDLVKRLVWPARDRRDIGGAPAPGELAPRLIDDEGRPHHRRALWAALAADAPPGADVERLSAPRSRAPSPRPTPATCTASSRWKRRSRALARSLEGRS